MNFAGIERIKYYTGVGSRNTPTHILNLMRAIGLKMALFGFGCRTGDAPGADEAFRDAANEASVFTPNWLDPFNNDIDPPGPQVFRASDCTDEAMAIASKYHPAWHRCSPFARKLHGRNAFQVLGRDLNDPSKYCICWTPDGCSSHATRTIKTGGTGTAISIADYYKVPIVNLQNQEMFDIWSNWTKS